jgi:hypothetical protein
MIRILCLLFLICCAHEKGVLPQDAKVTTKKFLTVKEAKNNLRNRWNYIFLLFEQSYDPYYGTPKWPLPCLEQNKQGKLREESGNSFFISQFLLNEKDTPGHCIGKSTQVIFLHCQNSLNVHEIHCPSSACTSGLAKSLCSSGAY